MMEDFWDPYGEPPEEDPDELEDDELPPIHTLTLEGLAARIDFRGAEGKRQNAIGRPQQGG